MFFSNKEQEGKFMQGRFLSCLMVLCLFLLAGSPAHAEKGSFYVGVHGGFNYMEDMDENLNGEVEMEIGSVYGVALGYTLKNVEGANLRLELEGVFRKNDDKEWSESSGLEGDVTSTAVMVNAGVEFVNKTRYTPVLLIGIGGAHVEFDHKVNGFSVENDSDTVFAYQVGAGCAVNLTEKLVVELGYRFFEAYEPERTDFADVTNVTNYQTHNLMLGMRYSF